MSNSTVLRYKGYTQTPFLWKEDAVDGIKQIEIESQNTSIDTHFNTSEIRLGKIVEQFVYQEFKQIKTIEWISDHIQVRDGKHTLGELDALCYQEEIPIHLEIVYKFYLYDTLETYTDPLAYWIGPNRKDTLLYKLDKLKHKQFPLLYNTATKSYLDTHHLDAKHIEQRVCFKAQLFMPYGADEMDVSPINSDCIYGFHLSFKGIDILKGFKIYIPEKLDWLITPHEDVYWLDYDIAYTEISRFIETKRSPLIWVKYPNDQLKKCFITFW